MTQAGFKAGLVGGAIAAVLQLAGLIPYVSCCTCLLIWVAYVGAGVLAGFWLPSPRSAGDGAGAGAIAGVIASIIGGIFGMITSAISFLVLGGAQTLAQLPPEFTDRLREMDIDPGMFSGTATLGGALGASALCCVAGLVIAAVLGAIGGSVYAAVKSE